MNIFHHQKNSVTMHGETGVSLTYCGHFFNIYGDESLSCIPATHIKSCVSHIARKQRKKAKNTLSTNVSCLIYSPISLNFYLLLEILSWALCPGLP